MATNTDPEVLAEDILAGGDSAGEAEPQPPTTTASPSATAPSATTPAEPSSPAASASSSPPGLDENPTDENFETLVKQFKALQDELKALKAEMESKRFLAAQAAEHLRIHTPAPEAPPVIEENAVKPPKPLDRKEVDKP